MAWGRAVPALAGLGRQLHVLGHSGEHPGPAAPGMGWSSLGGEPALCHCSGMAG